MMNDAANQPVRRRSLDADTYSDLSEKIVQGMSLVEYLMDDKEVQARAKSVLQLVADIFYRADNIVTKAKYD